ncbi:MULTISPECIES: hypothetical protein [unclassified Paraburkholderia]|uniref:hypothetical protein n=1 Tax=unclassified Paraburkholderia TaxID=2615204 RepID=UPI00161C9EFF|nr:MULTISPECIES: hypothetical protein [unclassified Paraburkholderia]MBB5443275.1 hypothetical protein [Paraburkholderia sp. WSM4177]MBB5483119.1 hypothetical protein [Paraburkholderia sp. WSM4180]
MKYANGVLLDMPCHLALCVDERAYRREMRRLKIDEHPPFTINGKPATAHWFNHQQGGQNLAIVCVDRETLADRTGTQIAALLVHEAVHVFQNICEHLGEESPSREFEAYSIQRIAQNLMHMYAELSEGGTK